MKRSRIRLALGGARWASAVGGLAEPAFAHVEPDPASVPAGSTDTITFNVEHGCEESDTVKLEMQLADGVTDATPASIDGWTSSVAGGVITWTGGPQPHDQELLVPVEMTFPNTPGETLLFPLVQTCEQGEIRWVDPPNPDGSEPEDPAPVVTLTAAARRDHDHGRGADHRGRLDDCRCGDHGSGFDIRRARDHGDLRGGRRIRQHRGGDCDRRRRDRRGRRPRRVASRPSHLTPERRELRRSRSDQWA